MTYPQGGFQSQPPQWNRPEPVQTFDWSDFINDTVIWVQGGVHERVKTQAYGEKTAARGSLVVLSGRYAGEVFDDRLVFATRLLSQIKAMQPGTYVLGRMVKSGQSVSMEPGSAYDEQLANQWVAAYPGKLDGIVRDALSNFAERAREMATGSSSASAPPQPSPQWQPQPQPTQPEYGPPAQPGAPAYMPQPTYPPGYAQPQAQPAYAGPPAMPAQPPPQAYAPAGSAPPYAPQPAAQVPQAPPAAPEAQASFQGGSGQPGGVAPEPAQPNGAMSATMASLTNPGEPATAAEAGF